MLTITRIPDEPAGTTAIFKLHPVLNEAKTKKEKRPIYDDIEVCEVYLAANKYTQGTFPAHDVWMNVKSTDPYGGEIMEPVTYAMRFNKQYLEFKNGDAQTVSGTPLAELPFLTEGKRRELKALNILTAEALAALDDGGIKRLGHDGRTLKNDAQAYLDKAASLAPLAAVKDELASRDETIRKMQAQIDAMLGSKTDLPKDEEEVTEQTKAGFATFGEDDLRQWLLDARVDFDKRWGRAKLLKACQDELAKNGKAQKAA